MTTNDENLDRFEHEFQPPTHDRTREEQLDDIEAKLDKVLEPPLAEVRQVMLLVRAHRQLDQQYKLLEVKATVIALNKLGYCIAPRRN